MTRIIAGFAGSLNLTVPSTGTRPTSDRVREAIFSALESRGVIEGARVLDLYAGTGSLGLEAASRGAAAVALVENGQAAARACRANAGRVLAALPKRSTTTIEVSTSSVQSFLGGAGGRWDLVFLDPPYDMGADELALALVQLAPQLTEDAVVLVERSSRSLEPLWPAGITLDRRKNYGDTTLWWASAAIAAPTT